MTTSAPISDNTAFDPEEFYAALEGSIDPSSGTSGTMRKVTSALRMALNVAFGLVLLILIVLTLGPKFYPFEAFYVRTGSMVPTIKVGALVIATQAPANSLDVGDIIVFPRPDRPDMMVVHRITALEKGPDGPVFVTKGDANDAIDEWRVPATGSGWHYRASYPGVGFIVGWARIALSSKGWVGGLAVLLSIWALVSIWQAPEPRSKKSS